MPKETKKETKQLTAAETLAKLETSGLKTGFVERSEQFYTTGNIAVDWALGGGFAVGKLVGVNGKSGSGKTTLVSQAMKCRQESGGVVVWADFERAFDKEYATQLGIDIDSPSFIYLKPRSLEQGCDAIYDLVESGEVSMVAIDSVARMTTESELDGKMSDLTVADKAKALYKFTRKILNSLDDNNCTLIVLNHLLEQINTAMPGVKTKISPGGNAVPYFASQILEAQVIHSVKSSASDAKFDAVDVQFTVTKNRLAPPSRQVVVRNEFGTGFNQMRSVLEIVKELEIVTVAGAWTTINDSTLVELLGKDKFNGYDNFVLAVVQNAEARGQLITRALQLVQGK
jgi:recombination protein RecA